MLQVAYLRRSNQETENNSHTEYNFMVHESRENAKIKSYDYGSHRSHNACAWLVQEISQMASRFALACRLRRVLAWLTQRTQRTQTLQVAAPSLPSGMYTLGETPTAVSDSDAAHSVKVCEVCVRQKNQREGNGKRAGWQAQAKRVCLCEFCALCVRQKKSA